MYFSRFLATTSVILAAGAQAGSLHSSLRACAGAVTTAKKSLAAAKEPAPSAMPLGVQKKRTGVASGRVAALISHAEGGFMARTAGKFKVCTWRYTFCALLLPILWVALFWLLSCVGSYTGSERVKYAASVFLCGFDPNDCMDLVATTVAVGVVLGEKSELLEQKVADEASRDPSNKVKSNLNDYLWIVKYAVVFGIVLAQVVCHNFFAFDLVGILKFTVPVALFVFSCAVMVMDARNRVLAIEAKDDPHKHVSTVFRFGFLVLLLLAFGILLPYFVKKDSAEWKAFMGAFWMSTFIGYLFYVVLARASPKFAFLGTGFVQAVYSKSESHITTPNGQITTAEQKNLKFKELRETQYFWAKRLAFLSAFLVIGSACFFYYCAQRDALGKGEGFCLLDLAHIVAGAAVSFLLPALIVDFHDEYRINRLPNVPSAETIKKHVAGFEFQWKFLSCVWLVLFFALMGWYYLARESGKGQTASQALENTDSFIQGHVFWNCTGFITVVWALRPKLLASGDDK